MGMDCGCLASFKKHGASPIFNFKFRYIDDVLSLNISRVGDFVDHICPIEVEIKDTTYTDRSARIDRCSVYIRYINNDFLSNIL
jgi:hypothetical protein